MTDGFEPAFRKLGGQIVLATTVSRGEAPMRPVLTAVLQSKTRLFFLPLFQPEGNRVLLQARKTPGFEDIVLIGDGALIESSCIEAARIRQKACISIDAWKGNGETILVVDGEPQQRTGCHRLT